MHAWIHSRFDIFPNRALAPKGAQILLLSLVILLLLLLLSFIICIIGININIIDVIINGNIVNVINHQ